MSLFVVLNLACPFFGKEAFYVIKFVPCSKRGKITKKKSKGNFTLQIMSVKYI